jgi:hypothetical protein
MCVKGDRLEIAPKKNMLKSSMHTYAQMHATRCDRFSQLVSQSAAEGGAGAFGAMWRAATPGVRQQCKKLILMNPPSLVFALFSPCSKQRDVVRVSAVLRPMTENEYTLTVDFSKSGAVSRVFCTKVDKMDASTLGADWELFRLGAGDLLDLELWNHCTASLISNFQPGVWIQPQAVRRAALNKLAEEIENLERYLQCANVGERAVFAAWFQSLLNFSNVEPCPPRAVSTSSVILAGHTRPNCGACDRTFSMPSRIAHHELRSERMWP